MFDYKIMKQPDKSKNNVSKYHLVETKGTDVIDIPNRKQVEMKEIIENRVLKILNSRQTQASTGNTQSRINGLRNEEAPQTYHSP